MAPKESDLEQGEKQPLLSERSERSSARSLKRGGTTTWKDAHHSHKFAYHNKVKQNIFTANPAFADALFLSVRAAFGCVIVASPVLFQLFEAGQDPLYPWAHTVLFGRTVDDWMKHISWTYCVIFMLYTLGPTVGATLSVAFQGLFGTLLAVVNIIIMFGLYPDGVTKHPEPWSDTVWYVGVFDFFVFVFLVIFLNCDPDVKLFACCEHVFFMMCFMDPKNTVHFSTGFHLGTRGAATSELITVTIGITAACVASLFPIPVWSRNRAINHSKKMVNEINEMWSDILDYYSGACKSTKIERLRVRADQIHEDLHKFGVMIDRMYYECFDLGTWGVVRKQLIELQTLLQNSHAAVLVALKYAEDEGFEESHKLLMQELAPDPPRADRPNTLLEFRKCARTTLEKAVDVSLDGSLSASEEKTLSAAAEELRRENAELALEFSQARTKICQKLKVDRLSHELLGEHAFVLSLSNYGRLSQEFVDQLLATKLQERPKSRIIRNPFDTKVLFKPDNLLFTFRNCGSIVACWFIGFKGFPFSSGSLIPPYTSAIAGTASLLLSAFVGSAMKRNLLRLQGVCLGTIIGQLIWVYFAWCGLYGVTTMTIAFFLWEFASIYTMHTSEEYGTVGGLVGVFGAKAMLIGCSNVVGILNQSKGGSYDNLVYVTVAIIVMCFFDVVLAFKRASQLATGTLFDATDYLEVQLNTFFKSDAKHVPAEMDYHCEAIERATIQGDEARQEPRYWRGKWNTEIFNECITCHNNIRESLRYLCLTLSKTGNFGGEKNDLFMELISMKEFFEVRDYIMERYSLVFGAATTVLTNEMPTKYDDEFYSLLEKKSRIDHSRFLKLLNACEKIAGPRSDEMLRAAQNKASPAYLYAYPICQCAMLVSQLEVISANLAALEAKILRFA